MELSQQKQSSVWVAIWVQTRSTIRYLIDHKPTYAIFFLALINGFISGFYWVETVLGFYPNASQVLLYSICTVGGALLGIVQLYLLSWLYMACGRWIGGKGTYKEVKCAIGWSFYPFVISGFVGLFSEPALVNVWVQAIVALISLTAFIWGLVMLFKLLAEAHRFESAWRGVATFVIGLLLIAGCFFVFTFIEALIL